MAFATSLALVVCLAGCNAPREGAAVDGRASDRAAPPPAGTGAAGQPRPRPPAEDRDCDGLIRRLTDLPELPNAELPPGERAALLLQVKSTPVVFVEPPASERRGPVARQWRRRLEASELPGRVLAKLLRGFPHAPSFVRQVLLTDGYLYAKTPALGATLAEGVTLGVLFREPRIVIERGSARLLAERDPNGAYLYADGAERGRAARLMLFDRVWADGDEPGPPRHVDLAALQGSLGFDEVAFERVTASGVVARALYGERSVRSVFERHGTSLALACEAADDGASDLRSRRELAARRRRALEHLRDAIRLGVDESLPFDEPRTEYGQQDGKLRQVWREAYFRGAPRYDFNGDTYDVFDQRGRPLVPEVCIDFVLDSFERAGGSWYAARGEPRARVHGPVDFDATGTLNRRNVEEFVALARRRGDWFELRSTPPLEQVPLERRTRFFATLFEHRREYHPGDVVVILGPRADEKLHYHSFFVFEADPLTGVPTLVAGNSGRPRVRPWVLEMASAPKRSVFARIRPSLELLEQATGARPPAAGRPLTAQAEPLRSPATP
jgi:hypothetical protein